MKLVGKISNGTLPAFFALVMYDARFICILFTKSRYIQYMCA